MLTPQQTIFEKSREKVIFYFATISMTTFVDKILSPSDSPFRA